MFGGARVANRVQLIEFCARGIVHVCMLCLCVRLWALCPVPIPGCGSLLYVAYVFHFTTNRGRVSPCGTWVYSSPSLSVAGSLIAALVGG
jgi:hypothetical protein